MPKRPRRARHATQKRQRPNLRSVTAVNLVTADVISLPSTEPVKLSISQLRDAWLAFRSRRKRDESPGE